MGECGDCVLGDSWGWGQASIDDIRGGGHRNVVEVNAILRHLRSVSHRSAVGCRHGCVAVGDKIISITNLASKKIDIRVHVSGVTKLLILFLVQGQNSIQLSGPKFVPIPITWSI